MPDRGGSTRQPTLSSYPVSLGRTSVVQFSLLILLDRPAGPSENETGREGQERTVREVWRRVRNLDYSRPGA